MRPSAWAAWQLATPRDFCSRVESLGVVAVGPPSLPAVGLRRRQRSRRRFALFAGARGRMSRPCRSAGDCSGTRRSKLRLQQQGHDNRTVTIDPGVYYGGISILNNSVVTFRPGIYVVKDGKFFVDSKAKVQGDGVGFYLTGNNATLHFTSIRESISPRLRPVPWLEFFSSRTAARRSSASIISIATASPGRRVPCTCHAAFFH